MSVESPMSHLAALELVSKALDAERQNADRWRHESNALRKQLAEHERWESGLRNIATLLGIGLRSEWEISDVVEAVRGMMNRGEP